MSHHQSLVGVVCGIAFAMLACDKKGPTTPTPTTSSSTSTSTTTTTTAPPITHALDGFVIETLPTDAVKISGALVEIAGQSRVVDDTGYYFFEGLPNGPVILRASRSGYQSRSIDINLTSSRRQSIALSPEPRTIEETLFGDVSGGDATCSDGTFTKPCKVFKVGIHNPGTIEAVLSWSGSNDLDLSLWRGSTLIARSASATQRTETISASIAASSLFYELHVTYYQGSTIQSFRLDVRRPS